MMLRLFFRASLLPALLPLLLIVPSVPAVAATGNHWINKIQQAGNHTSYEGTFVYRQGDQMEVMRIAHRANKKGIREKLVSLNGWAREIIRNNDEVVCYLPDKKAVMAGHRSGRPIEQTKFPAILPDKIEHLNKSYRISTSNAERIAGRPTVLVSIDPRDSLRYGYRFWADKSTGLLLKSDLVDSNGKTIEQFMFTDIKIGQPIKDKDLQPTYSGKGMVWHRGGNESSEKVPDSEHWQVHDLPAGFRVTGRMIRDVPGKAHPVTHLVISDGLAAVSVFIESAVSTEKNSAPMVTSMGAAHAYRASMNGHQITAVGEVPATTVEQIGRSLSDH
jgi:sigma-E factor negative regulatory protein RseB